MIKEITEDSSYCEMYKIMCTIPIDNITKLTTTRLSKVNSNQLNHVRLQKIHVPPRSTFNIGQTTRGLIKERGSRSIHGLLRDSSIHNRALHGSLTSGHIEDCKINLIFSYVNWSKGDCFSFDKLITLGWQRPRLQDVTSIDRPSMN